MKTWTIALASALMASPVFAQGAAPQQSGQQMQGKQAMGMQHSRLFSDMSQQGRESLFQAMRSTQQERQAVKAARDRVTALIGADRLDSAALKSAMDDETRLVSQQHARRQAAVLAAIEKLSAADRKAFATASNRARNRVEAKTNDWRNRNMQNRGQNPGQNP